MNSKIILIIILAIIVIISLWLFAKHKYIKCNSVLMIDGAPKTGKSLLSIYTAIQKVTIARIKWCINKSISYILHYSSFGYLPISNKLFPELYSNIPINHPFGYIPITKEILIRKVKIIDKSAVYLGEFSLVANSRLGQRYGTTKDIDYDKLNEELLLFTKLSGHEFNGYLIIDSQTISDCHYAVKRVLSNYLYIHHSINLLFHKILFVREMMYSDDNNSINTTSEDVEEKLKWLLVPKFKYYRMYDFRCYSIFTDSLPNANDVHISPQSLKADNIVSFVDFKTLKLPKK